MSTQLEYEDYTVAWIAVLQIEAEAALKVLDQRHDGLFESSLGDDYLYIGGELNGHNVVIATLPAGQVYGIGSAAALASHVKARFVNIRFALLVGVAAGLPNLSPDEHNTYRDIRLGDVLVSEPDQSSTGIVHYDLGRNTEDGFKIIGRSNEPPAILRSAYTHMKLLHERAYKQGNILAACVQHLQDTDGSEKFLRPDSSTDQLFGISLQDDQPKEIYRKPRRNDENTLIWYGNIGSGNSLMRNAKQRDELRDRYNLIGLEMEAAGVTNTLPTGVIRGVCDYGDRHKTKQWQPYAAAVAAVYAKGILGFIPTENSYKRQKLKEYQGYEYDKLKLNKDEEGLIEVLASLAFPQMYDRRLQVRKPYGGTCRWILDLPLYHEWDSRACGLLWIKGKPGAGKSTLMRFLYSLIGEKMVLDTTTYLEFFFNARGDALQYTFVGMLRSLLNQIFQQDLRSRALIIEIYRKKQAAFGGGSRKWDWLQEELEQLLEQAILDSSSRRRIFIFIDALDEAGEDAASTITEYFHSINAQLFSRSATSKIYISCRHYPITSEVGGTEICVEDHNYDDIKAYVEARVYGTSRLSIFLDLQQWRQLMFDIVEQAKGSFQWVSLILPLVERSIRNGCSPTKTRSRLSEIPQGISDTYKHILTNVIDRSNIQQSFLLFQWVCLVERPLNLSELRYALAASNVSPPLNGLVSVTCCETAGFIASDQAMIVQLKALSGGLLEYTYNVVQVVHQTVKEFLMNDGLALLESITSEMGTSLGETKQKNIPTDSAETLQKCHSQLYWSCLKYLAIEQLEPPTKKEITRVLRNRSSYPRVIVSGPPFTSYAAQYTFLHAGKAQHYHIATTSKQAQLIDRIFRRLKSMKSGTLWQDGWSLRYNHMITLHVAAAFGLEDLMRYVLTTEIDVNARLTATMFTALYLAARFDQPSTARQLLDAKAEVDAGDNEGKTSLMLAAFLGYERIAELLLVYHAKPDTQDQMGMTALMLASISGHTELIRLLLKYQVDVNIRDKRGRTALIVAIESHETGVARLLLEYQADVNIQDDCGRTALILASIYGHAEIMRLLLEHRANLNIQDDFGGSALSLTSVYGQIELARLLLEHQANVNIQDNGWRTPLMSVSSSGHTEMMRLLMEHQANLNIQDNCGETALMKATDSHEAGAVRLLLEHQANVNIQDEIGRTALMSATAHGDTEIMRLLLEHQANVNIRDNDGRTALTLTSISGQSERLRLFLEQHANVTIQEDDNSATVGVTAGP